MKLPENVIYNQATGKLELDINTLTSIIEATAKKTGTHVFSKIVEERAKENCFDKRLYNVRILLEHYLILKEHVSNAVFELRRMDEDDLTAIEILDTMCQANGPGRGEIAVEAIKKSTVRTEIILKHIDEMLAIYEAMCYRSNKPEDERRYDVIKTLYLTPLPAGKNKSDLQFELAEKYFTSDRQIRRDVNDAIERITALIFGIDGIALLERQKHKPKP